MLSSALSRLCPSSSSARSRIMAGMSAAVAARTTRSGIATDDLFGKQILGIDHGVAARHIDFGHERLREGQESRGAAVLRRDLEKVAAAVVRHGHDGAEGAPVLVLDGEADEVGEQELILALRAVRALAFGSSVKDFSRTSPLSPCARPNSPRRTSPPRPTCGERSSREASG